MFSILINFLMLVFSILCFPTTDHIESGFQYGCQVADLKTKTKTNQKNQWLFISAQNVPDE
jgi:hypothetical protein